MLGFQPVSEAYSLSEKVFDQVTDAISAGRYSPGDKLPSENELVNVFKVSRTLVREAMKMLAGQGLITVKRGLGAYIADYRGPSRLSNLQTILSPHTENILELFQIRKILESEAAAWAAQKARPTDLEKMERLLIRAKTLALDPKCKRNKLNKINSDFHYALVEASGNRTLQKVMTGLMDMMTGVRDITLQLPGRYSGSVVGHREILTAIENGDSAKARRCMAKHLEEVETIIKNTQHMDRRPVIRRG